MKSPATMWGYAAYAAIPFDGKRHEIIAGDHFVNPATSLHHQQVSRHLQYYLFRAIELPGLGCVINAPVDVQLSDHDIVQPDLVVIRKANLHIQTPSRVKGIPDLLIEILSPSNPGHDLKTKRLAYQRCGVPEYWIVDPDEHQILVLTLANGQYQETTATDTITFDIPPLLAIDLKQVW
ncbi:MAG: Uma2 family endonuclease [Pirellulaceae bacterium]|nr:Uma2 family endonuclease [Pirellulaceae bacterium]